MDSLISLTSRKRDHTVAVKTVL